MRLLLGPPGSGKSSVILGAIRERLRSTHPAFVLLVPTATMAEHMRNLLAREGLLVRPNSIQTLAGFLDRLMGDAPVAPRPVLDALTAQVIDEQAPSAISALAGSNGLAASMASAIDELASAGCDALQWEAFRQLGTIRSSAMTGAFGSVYDGVEDRLRRAGLQLRAARIASAIQRLREAPLEGVEHVYIDGFFTLSAMELKLVQALASCAEVTLVLPEWEGVHPLHEVLVRSGAKVRRFHPVRPQPTVYLFDAATRDREVEQIALRLRDLNAQGVRWGECVVIVRGRDPYVPLLECALDRFGVPCRAYFATPLMTHPVCRSFTSAIQALLSGFEHSLVLDALRSPVTRAGVCATFPIVENLVRNGLPESGVDAVRALARRAGADPGVFSGIRTLVGLDRLTQQAYTPQRWPDELRALSNLLAPPTDDFSNPQVRREWRLRAMAERTFFTCLADAARLMPTEPVALDVFWRDVQPILRNAEIRVVDHRREAVAVIDAYEARQWEAPYVFVCGLIEGEFPRRRSPDAVLGDGIRLALNRAGVPVSTRQSQEDEESFLLDMAFTRSTRELMLSWPRFNEKGDANLRSFRLASVSATPAPTRAAAIVPCRPVTARLYPSIDAITLRERLAEQHQTLSATSLESFVQCPFQFYSSHSMKLRPPALLPADRLDARLKGSILHTVLAEWHKGGGSMEDVFASVWRRELQAARVSPSHKVEHERITMLRALRTFAANARIETGWRVYVEEAVSLALGNVEIRGRIDRYDVNDARQARIFDFKYTGAGSVRKRRKKMDEGLSLQGGLYALALRRNDIEPVSFKYCAVRGEIAWAGPDTAEETQDAMNLARAISETAAQRINEGDIAVHPADEDACKWCDYRNTCRIVQQAGEAEEIAGAMDTV